MKKLLILCPTSREMRALPSIAGELGIELIFDPFGDDYFDSFLGKDPKPARESLDILGLIDEVVEKYRGTIDGVTSAVGYPGMSASSIIAKRLGLPGPDPKAIMICEHKYYSRVSQQEVVPHATPSFHLIDPKTYDDADAAGIQFPAFLKPVKSCMSMNAFKVESKQELSHLVKRALLPMGFIQPFNDMWNVYGDALAKDATYLLVESQLEGAQVSLEGYVFDGEVHIFGVLDAVMFPGTISFKRFELPSRLPADVLARMHEIAKTYISSIGYDNALFNIELIYNPEKDTIHIIEINPKIASQFPDLFFKVDGSSTYKTMMEIALGIPPSFHHAEGQYKVAGSCVLRIFED